VAGLTEDDRLDFFFLKKKKKKKKKNLEPVRFGRRRRCGSSKEAMKMLRLWFFGG
jgi:hypothetical protein